MAHELESMFSVKQTPWHGLGTIVQEAPTSLEAIKLAGLDWTVAMEQIFTHDGAIIPTHRAARRSSDGRVLGVVGNVFTPLQNRDAFNFFDPLVEAGEARYETAGSLREGARVWILAKINRDNSEIVPGGEIAKYVLLSNGHDGKWAATIGYTGIRVVCANTLAAARTTKNSKLIRVNHSKRVVENVEALRETMNIANESFEATAEKYRDLARRNINKKDLEKYISLVFDLKSVEPTEADPKPRRSRILNDVVELFETGRGSDIPGVGGTMWGAYNAVTEYLSYGRGDNEATRLDNLWFGDSAVTNKNALETALNYNYLVAA